VGVISEHSVELL